MNLFVRSVCDVLEDESLGLSSRFRETSGWCSLKAFGLLVLMENDWGAPVSIDRLGEMETVRDLFREAFIAFAATVFKVPVSSLSGETEYESIPEWDSVNHLRLVMEAEKLLGVSYPIWIIPEMRRLDDFLCE